MSKHAAKRDKGSTFYLLTPNIDYPIEMGEVSFGKFRQNIKVKHKTKKKQKEKKNDKQKNYGIRKKNN